MIFRMHVHDIFTPLLVTSQSQLQGKKESCNVHAICHLMVLRVYGFIAVLEENSG